MGMGRLSGCAAPESLVSAHKRWDRLLGEADFIHEATPRALDGADGPPAKAKLPAFHTAAPPASRVPPPLLAARQLYCLTMTSGSALKPGKGTSG